MNELTTKDLFKLLAPFLALTAVGAIFVVLLMFRFLPLGGHLSASVVAFDVIKYTNAQRAVASSFIKPGADVSGANELLLNLPERTRQTIAAVAGAGTLVVLKQAVVQGTTEDITDAVLKKLGLPLNVPTADATAYVMDGAPTMFMNAPAQKVPQGVLGSAQQALP